MGLRAKFSEAHRRLEGVLDRLRRDEQQGSALASSFAMLDRSLRELFDEEEAYLLPRLRRTDPSEAAVLAGQHQDLRARLAALRALVTAPIEGSPRGLLVADLMGELAAELRLHRERKEGFLYPWAEQHLGRYLTDSLTPPPPPEDAAPSLTRAAE